MKVICVRCLLLQFKQVFHVLDYNQSHFQVWNTATCFNQECSAMTVPFGEENIRKNSDCYVYCVFISKKKVDYHHVKSRGCFFLDLPLWVHKERHKKTSQKVNF